MRLPRIARAIPLAAGVVLVLGLWQPAPAPGASPAPGTPSARDAAAPGELVYVSFFRGVHSRQYHRQDCPYLKGAITALPLAEAAKKCVPCAVCMPPELSDDVTPEFPAGASDAGRNPGGAVGGATASPAPAPPASTVRVGTAASQGSRKAGAGSGGGTRVRSVDCSRSNVNIASLATGDKRTVVMVTSPG